MPVARQHPLLRFLAYAKPYWIRLAVVVLSGIVGFGAAALAPYLIRQIIDRVVVNEGGLTAPERRALLWWLGAGAGGTVTVIALLRYQRSVMMLKVISWIIFDIRQAMWRHLQRLSLGFHQTRPTGSILSRLMGDIQSAQQIVNAGISSVLINTVGGIVAVVILVSVSWQLTLVALVVLPLYAGLYRKLNPRIRQASRDVREQTAVMSGDAVERLSGIAVVQSFAQEPAEQQYFEEQSEELRDLSVRRGRLHRGLRVASNWIVEMAGIVGWFIGAHLAIAGGLSAGKIVQFTGTAMLLYRPIRQFSDLNIIYQDAMASIERVFAIFDILPEVRNRPNALDQAPSAGAIELDQLSFRYEEDGPLVLEDVCAKIASGERVAIVGESGAGKSTLATLVPRLYDVTGGAIRIDGVDVRDYRIRRLRRSIGIVLQDTILFSGPIRENLRYGNKDASEEEIIAAAQAANAHEFIERLPEQYDTIIGERGLTLSGGQRQRVSLARTILQNPRILILDEATSSLDSESENLITEALERAQTGRTCLIIAHRLSTVIGADRVLVFNQGRLVEEGAHADLLEAGGYYSYLFDQQFRPLQELMGGNGDD